MSVEKINIFGEDDEEMGIPKQDEKREQEEREERPEKGPEPGLEIIPNKKQDKDSELPPSMRISTEKKKPKKPELPN